jgi:tetratricopeptide (TPR) repeat protein
LFGERSPEDKALGDMDEALRLYRKGAFREALQLADRLIASAPSIALSWRFRGECLFSLQRYSDAVASFDKAAALGARGTEDLFLWSALALHNAGKPDEAKALLRQKLTAGLRPELRARTEEALQKLGGP